MAGEVYSASQITAAATRFTIQAVAAPNAVWILQFMAGNNSTNVTITRQRITLQRSTAGTTPTNVTEDKWNSRSPVNSSNIVTGWVTPPTLSGQPLLILGSGLRQGYSALQKWTPPRPNATPQIQDAEQIDIRSVDTGGNVAATVAITENLPSLLVRPSRRSRSFSWVFNSSNNRSGVAGSIPNGNQRITAWGGQYSRPLSRRGIGWNLLFGGAPVSSDRPKAILVVISNDINYLEV